MEALSLDGVELGWVPWSAPMPVASVVVRLRLPLGDEGEPAEVEETLTDADLVPWKREVDVLVRGFAHAATAAQRIPCRLRLGSIDLPFVARALLPSTRIPLGESFVTDEAGTPIDVGPAAIDLRCGIPLVLHRFDFGAYQLARRAQRIASLEPGELLRLDSLRPGGVRWSGRLPPRLRVAVRRGEGRWIDIEPTVDTVTVDSDRGWVAITARAIIDEPSSVRAVLGHASSGPGEDAATRAVAAALFTAHHLPHAPALGPATEVTPRSQLPGRVA